MLWRRSSFALKIIFNHLTSQFLFNMPFDIFIFYFYKEPDFIDDDGLYDDFDLESDLALCKLFLISTSIFSAHLTTCCIIYFHMIPFFTLLPILLSIHARFPLQYFLH